MQERPNDRAQSKALDSAGLPDAPGCLRLGAQVWRITGGAGGQAIMVERRADLVVLDTTASMDHAAEVLGTLRLITDKPIGAVIYGSGALAAIGGAAGLVGHRPARVIAAARLAPAHVKSGDNTPGLHQVRKIRGARLSGGLLGQSDDPNQGRGFLPVTDPVGDTPLDLSEPDLPIQVLHTPGLRGDQLSLWLPQARLLAGSDLLAEHDTLTRQMLLGPMPAFHRWQATLERVQALCPQVLAPVRGTPQTSAAQVDAALRDHLAAFAELSRQVAQGLARGHAPAELAQLVRLPGDLAHSPHLGALVANLGWVVQAYCHETMGCFDGNPTSLARLSPREEARRVIRLGGGAEALLREAETTEDPQWGLELCDRLILAGERTKDARLLKSACLQILAEGEENTYRRAYYLACAREYEV